MQKKDVLIARLVLFLFCATGVYLLSSNLMLRRSLKEITRVEANKKDRQLEQHKKLQDEQRRDLQERYQADVISYQAMVKRLEQEKNKQKELKGERLQP